MTIYFLFYYQEDNTENKKYNRTLQHRKMKHRPVKEIIFFYEYVSL